jgi:hypothetical protein
MTITAAWVRTLRDCKELIIVSDSRLNGGRKMDCGQKVIALPRSDAFICFAGNAGWAYPLMHQAANAISTYEKSASRALDIVALKSHVLKVFEGLRQSVHDAVGDEGIPSAEFLFGGYSWISKKFLIWKIHYHVPNLRTPPKGAYAQGQQIKEKSRFVATLAKTWHGQPWIISGDEEFAIEARQRMSDLLIKRGKAPHQVKNFKFDWEPFEVIRDMLREVESNPFKHRNLDIGGAPQILKIYEHLSSRYLGVAWGKDKEDVPRTFVCGRQVLPYEIPTLWILNPDTLVSSHPFYTERNSSSHDSENPTSTE